MDMVSKILANLNYTAVTSRYIYKKINDKTVRIPTQNNSIYASETSFMSDLLDQIITNSSSAVVNFSVSAAHFIEVDWCYKKTKKTVGLAYVRSIVDYESQNCDKLKIIKTPRGYYSTCDIDSSETQTIWKCMKSGKYCPFIKQDISKNVIEYFFRGKNMSLIALEDLNSLSYILNEKYPFSEKNKIIIDDINNDLLLDGEFIFSKKCIYIILRLKKLMELDWNNRIDVYKMINILQKIIGWNNNYVKDKVQLNNFITGYVIPNNYIYKIKEGYIDLELVIDEYDDFIKILSDNDYIKIEKFDEGNNIKGYLIKLTDKGLDLAKLYEKL